ncbi:MAG: glycosyltransferase [Leptolyngbyaceae cyanobacterium SL_5_9]|nr:glycosyltransferase [Leptolyngbyaceae cyanobacterium SL_5_9]NJO76709.1 glycosyltransferase [Leptolyngbyaceae cyanobacterium RM1_406_9]
MIRITLIAGTYQPDLCGVAHYTSRLREALAEEVESIVLTTQAAAEALSDDRVRGVVQNWQFAGLFSLVRAIQTIPTDILHIQHAAGTYSFQRPIFLLPLLLRASGYRCPIVTTVHEYGWWEWQPKGIPTQLLEWLKQWGQQRQWWDREDGFLLTGSQAIITTNAEAENAICDRLPHLSHRLHRIPIAANVEVAPIERSPASQLVRQTHDWLEETLVIAFFGFLHPVKGLENLFLAFKQILTTVPQARLLLIGGVESLALPQNEAKYYWNKLQDQVLQLGMSQQVKMTGYVSEAIASHYLSGSDLGVLPFNHGVTLKSGSLLVLLAHQLPTVATYSDPPDSELTAANIVCSISSRNPDALATALLKLIENPDLQKQLSAAGSEFVKQFSWEAIAQKHLQIYKSLLNKLK